MKRSPLWARGTQFHWHLWDPVQNRYQNFSPRPEETEVSVPQLPPLTGCDTLQPSCLTSVPVVCGLSGNLQPENALRPRGTGSHQQQGSQLAAGILQGGGGDEARTWPSSAACPSCPPICCGRAPTPDLGIPTPFPAFQLSTFSS